MRIGNEQFGKIIFATDKNHDIRDWLKICPPDTIWDTGEPYNMDCSDNLTEDFGCVTYQAPRVPTNEESYNALRNWYNNIASR